MSARVISLPRVNARTSRPSAALDRRQVRLTSRKLGTVVLPWWPDEIAWGNMAAVYDEQDRPGRLPLLLRTGIGLEELRIGTVIRPRDLEGSTLATPAGASPSILPTVSSILDSLRAMSRSTAPLTVAIAGRTGSYRITDLGITELDWTDAGEPLVAEIALTLKAASDAVVPVGPIKPKGRGR